MLYINTYQYIFVVLQFNKPIYINTTFVLIVYAIALNFQLMCMGSCFYCNYDTIENEISMMRFHFFEY